MAMEQEPVRVRSWDECKSFLRCNRNFYNFLVSKTRAWLLTMGCSADWLEWAPVQVYTMEQMLFCPNLLRFVPAHLSGRSIEQWAAETCLDQSLALLEFMQRQYNPDVKYPEVEPAPAVSETGIQPSQSLCKWRRKVKTFVNPMGLVDVSSVPGRSFLDSSTQLAASPPVTPLPASPVLSALAAATVPNTSALPVAPSSVGTAFIPWTQPPPPPRVTVWPDQEPCELCFMPAYVLGRLDTAILQH